MFIEEKRYGKQPKPYQQKIFNMLSWCGKHHARFYGFHILIFENTNPEDGKIFIDGKEASKDDLMEFLQFKGQIFEGNGER